MQLACVIQGVDSKLKGQEEWIECSAVSEALMNNPRSEKKADKSRKISRTIDPATKQ